MKDRDILKIITTLKDMDILHLVGNVSDAFSKLDKIVEDYCDEYNTNSFIKKVANEKFSFRSQSTVAHEILLGKTGVIEKSCQKSLVLTCHWLWKLTETVRLNVAHFHKNGLTIQALKNDSVTNFLEKISYIPKDKIKRSLQNFTGIFRLASAKAAEQKTNKQSVALDDAFKLSSPGPPSFKYASSEFQQVSRGTFIFVTCYF